jgi:hypothetical protein
MSYTCYVCDEGYFEDSGNPRKIRHGTIKCWECMVGHFWTRQITRRPSNRVPSLDDLCIKSVLTKLGQLKQLEEVFCPSHPIWYRMLQTFVERFQYFSTLPAACATYNLLLSKMTWYVHLPPRVK